MKDFINKDHKNKLRKEAEDIIENRKITDDGLRKDIQKIIYELKVHEIELEMQNEELKRVQEELVISNSKYSNLYEYAPISYITTNIHGLIKQINLTTVKLLGYDKTDLINKPFTVLVAENYISKFFHYLNSMKEAYHSIDFELPMLTKNNKQIHVWIHGSLNDESSILLALIDITQRKKAEIDRDKAEALEKISRQSEEIYRNMFEKNSAVQILMEPNRGDIIKVNEAASKFYGYSTETLKTMNISQISFLQTEQIMKNIRLAYTGERNNFIVKHKLANGDVRYMDIYICMVNYYGEELLYLILHDITDRIEAEYKLKHSRERYRNLLESISDRIYVLDHDLRFVVINEAVVEFVKKSREDIIGKQITEVFTDIKSYPVYDAIIKVLNTSKPIVIEDNITQNEGKDYWYNVNIYPVPEGALCITSNITLQKENENSLRIMNEKLKKSNEELEQFAYIASHDLQEPIRMISNFSEILRQDYYEKLDQDAREYIDTIIDGSERMSEIVADLLEYSRIEKKKRPFDNIDLNEVLNKVIKNLDTLIKSKKAQIIHDDLPTIFADKVQIILVLQNLLSNAIKFVKDKTPVIYIKSKSLKNKWIISVRDNGIGISKTYHDKIFEMFRRLHTKDEYPGTGIGLTSCKKIIDRHNGDIWLESELGKGSTFYFSIPCNTRQIQ